MYSHTVDGDMLPSAGCPPGATAVSPAKSFGAR